MFSKEVKTTVYIGVGAVLLAIVLGIASIAINIKGDLANTQNKNIYTSQSIAEFEEFENYNSKVIYGSDVIALISDYGNYEESHIGVYVNGILLLNSIAGRNTYEYYNHVEGDRNTFDTTAKLSSYIDPRATYFVYLIYDEYFNPENPASAKTEIRNARCQSGADTNFSRVSDIKVVRLWNGSIYTNTNQTTYENYIAQRSTAVQNGTAETFAPYDF